jgi:VanZ family protein
MTSPDATTFLGIDTHRWRVLLVLLVVVVSYLAIVPAPPREIDTGWDKLNHVMAFTALALSGRFAFPGPLGRWASLVLGLLAFGALIEVVQYFIPGRDSEWNDLAADTIGIAAGALLALCAQRLRALVGRASTGSARAE